MRFVCVAVIVIFATLLNPANGQGESFDWDAWRDLAVQNGGRHKPLDTLAWETLRITANRNSVVDPVTNEKLDPLAFYLTSLFEWQGWDHAQKEKLKLATDWRPMYFYVHEADHWDRMPLLRVDFLALRARLGLPPETNRISPADLVAIQCEDDQSQRSIPFSTWAERLVLAQQGGKTLNEVEKAGLALAERLWAYQNHRMGKGMEIGSLPSEQGTAWVPIAQLLLNELDGSSDPTGELRQVQRLLNSARTALRTRDASTFNSASRELKGVLVRLAHASTDYPREQALRWEVAYNRWAPFRIAWVLMMVAAISMLVSWGTGGRGWTCGALIAYLAAFVALLAGFGLRTAIAGRPPVTNMYESVVYVGAGVALFGLIFELIYRKKFILTAAAVVTMVILVLADNCPLVLDPSLRPLEPVLRNNFWLVTHVMTITLSYAAFALALGIGNITLGFLASGSGRTTTVRSLSQFTYRVLQAGVLLLAAGTILGGVWADYSWGRFWGWDPKEVWALVALLGYLAVLHARFAGWVGDAGLAALSVVCFSLVVMAWYGVNFVLGAGLHSYGFGGGGQGYVFAATGLQLLLVAAAIVRARLVGGPSLMTRPGAASLRVVESGDASIAIS